MEKQYFYKAPFGQANKKLAKIATSVAETYDGDVFYELTNEQAYNFFKEMEHKAYVFVGWPESQNYMGDDNVHLVSDLDGEYVDSAYMVQLPF